VGSQDYWRRKYEGSSRRFEKGVWEGPEGGLPYPAKKAPLEDRFALGVGACYRKSPTLGVTPGCHWWLWQREEVSHRRLEIAPSETTQENS